MGLKRGKKNKKAISPVIATVLLVSITIILAAIIFFWARGLIKEQIEKFNKAAELVCQEVNFNAQITEEGGRRYLYISNIGNIPIQEIELKIFSGGKAIIKRNPVSLDAGESSQQEIIFEGAYEKIKVIPVIAGTGKSTSFRKLFVCPEEYGKDTFE